MKNHHLLIHSLLLSALLFTACSTPSQAPTSTSSAPPATATLSPSETPIPSATSLLPTTFTPLTTSAPTEPAGNVLNLLTQYLESLYSIDITEVEIKNSTLEIKIETNLSTREDLRSASWRLFRDFALKLKELSPEADPLVDLIGVNEYRVELKVFSSDGSLVYQSETYRETLKRVQADQISQSEWEDASEAKFR